MSAFVHTVLGGFYHVRNTAVRLVLGLCVALCALTLSAVPAMAQTITGATISPTTYSGAGQTITLTVTVDSGNRVASSATVTSQIGAVYSCPIADTTNTGVTFTCTANYSTTATDVATLQIQEQPVVRMLSFGTPTIMTYNGILQATYVAPASPPTVTSISPGTGPTSGGTTVTITGTNFSGATAVTFGATAATGFTVNSASQITATAPSGAAGTVDVRVTTGAGTSATSAADQFTYVAAPAVVAISPTSGPAGGGTSVTITGTNFSGTTAVTFGATAASGFTVNSATQITATAPAGTGTVDVRITTSGGTSATSAADRYSYISLASPSVTTNPSNQNVNAGGSATFTAAAIGNPAPTVQWQVSTNGGGSFSDIAGATSTTLTFTAQASENGNFYHAVFTNSQGSAITTAAALTVNTAPVVTINPVNQTVTSGSNATFTAAASGNPAPTVQWQVDSGAGYTNIAGATSTTLSFTAQASDAGNSYRAVFTNAAGSAATSGATLLVNSAPVVTTNPVDQTTLSGDTATFTAAASGNPAPTVQWQFSSDGGATFNNLAGSTSNSLLVAASTAANGYQYRAVYTNSAGSATTTAAVLTVNKRPQTIVVTSAAPASAQVAGATYTPSASASSGLTVAIAIDPASSSVCSIASGAVSFQGTGTCTVNFNQAGDSETEAAPQAQQSFAVAQGANVISFAPLPSRALASGSFAVSATATSGMAVTFSSTTAATCSVSGSTVSLLAVGTCTVVANQAGNANYSAATPVSQSFAITRAVTTVALSSSASTVFFGQPVTLTATVGGVSPTGTVTFTDGATTLGTVALAGSTANFTSSTLSAGAHSFTATYNGDASNDVSTSSAVTVTVNARPDPSADPDVRSSTDQQFRQTQRFVRSQIDNIGGRLDQLHSEGDNRSGMAVRISQVRPQLASALPFGGVAAPAPNETDAMAGAAMGGSNAAQPVGTVAAGAAAASAAGIAQDEAPRWSIWASGDVSFGKQQPSGQVETRFTSQGLTVGMDGRFSDNLKLGAAFGFGWDNSRIGTNGSENDASNASLAFYGSWRAAPQFYIDGIVGLGYGTINTTRYSTTGGVFLDGKRRTSQTFAALIATWEGRIGTIEFAPYLRADGIWVHLSPYSETGSTTWALAFQAADENSFSAVAGARLRFPLGGGWKLIGKGEYRTRLSGDYTQLLGYADLQGIQGSPYAITGTGVDDSSFTGGLGIEGRLRQATIRLNYDLTTMSGGNIANRFSGALIVPF